MTYWVRGAILSLGFFALVYLTMSAMVALGVRFVGARFLNAQGARSTRQLYLLRLLPLGAALAALLALVIPSFIAHEPAHSAEVIGLPSIALAMVGAGILILGLARVLKAWRQSARFVAACEAASERLMTPGGEAALQVSAEAANLLLVGILRPRLFISSRATALLDSQELEAAMQHEISHGRHYDNLKKLLLQLCAFPGMAAIEREWLRRAEIEADDSAVKNPQEALALASALIKVAGEHSTSPVPALAMNLLPEAGAPLKERVDRLLGWSPKIAQRRSHFAHYLGATVILLLLVVAHQPTLLRVHELTELLLR